MKPAEITLRDNETPGGVHTTMMLRFGTERCSLTAKFENEYLAPSVDIIVLTYEEMDQLVEEYQRRKAQA